MLRLPGRFVPRVSGPGAARSLHGLGRSVPDADRTGELRTTLRHTIRTRREYTVEGAIDLARNAGLGSLQLGIGEGGYSDAGSPRDSLALARTVGRWVRSRRSGGPRPDRQVAIPARRRVRL